MDASDLPKKLTNTTQRLSGYVQWALFLTIPWALLIGSFAQSPANPLLPGPNVPERQKTSTEEIEASEHKIDQCRSLPHNYGYIRHGNELCVEDSELKLEKIDKESPNFSTPKNPEQQNPRKLWGH